MGGGVGEVVRLIEAVTHPICRMALLTAYAAGLRISELVSLKVEHIDAERMQLHVELGKGQKPRMVPLSEVLLALLRDYWRHDRPKIKGSPWLFPGRKATKPLDVTVIQRACEEARVAARIAKRATPHTLRHCYATHMLEAGTDVHVLQALLGHSMLSTTAIYLHVQRKLVKGTKSPLDAIEHFRSKVK